jgi:integrase/recombinase XerC
MTQKQDLQTEYLQKLERAPLSANTKRAYASRVAAFLEWLPEDSDLAEERDFVIRDYRQHLKDAHRAPSTVNSHLDAVGHFCLALNLGTPNARHERLPQASPRALEPREQTLFLRAAEKADSLRDRAIGLLGFYSGLRVAEISALNLSDVVLSARKGQITVWHGKGDHHRELPLHPEARSAISDWLKARGESNSDALFLNQRGARLSSRSICEIVAQLGASVGLEITTHTLRHTFGTNLVRQGTDVVIVAEMLGHSRLESTRRYSLPSAGDREAAIGGLPVEG